MSHEDDGSILRADDEPRGRDVAVEGQGRILDDLDVDPITAQEAVDRLPAGTVDEAAVDEDNAQGVIGLGHHCS
jgi:hypothetical protein